MSDNSQELFISGEKQMTDLVLGLGSKIKFDGEDREGNPYIIAPISLVNEWHDVEPFSRHPDSNLSGGFYACPVNANA